jgi:hypothetical protein
MLPRRIKGAAEPEPDPRREPEMEVVPIPSVAEVRLLFFISYMRGAHICAQSAGILCMYC